MHTRAEAPVGIFDSGVGGLSAAYQLERILPFESYIYFGDTARVPYGTRTVETVKRYSLQDGRFLVSKGVKAILVACGTASSNALEPLRSELDIPVVGVIDGAAERAYEAAEASNGVIAVLGTAATIRSGAFERALKARDPALRIISRACPMFVPLVENGYTDGQVAELIAREYLNDLIPQKPSAVILGCTHYPMLSPVIGRILEDSVLVDSSAEAVITIADVLGKSGIRVESRPEYPIIRQFFVSDDTEGFEKSALNFLGRSVGASIVDINAY